MSALQRAAGRPWNLIGVPDSAIGDALGISRRNAARRREGYGPYAQASVELFRLEVAGICTFALRAHLNSVAMQASFKHRTVDWLNARLIELQAEEKAITGKAGCAQVDWLINPRGCRQQLRDAQAAQAKISEEIVAVCDELEERERRK